MHKVNIHLSKLIFDKNFDRQVNSSIAFHNDFPWEPLYEQLKSARAPLVYSIYNDDPLEAFEDFSSNFLIIEAAGGVVENSLGQILMIYRLGKWDLPKGKMEPGEDERSTALREVEEECGISSLRITDENSRVSFHTYEINGTPILKKTYWFKMHSNEKEFIAQAEEGIEKVCWVSKGPELQEKLNNSFQNIRDLLI